MSTRKTHRISRREMLVGASKVGAAAATGAVLGRSLPAGALCLLCRLAVGGTLLYASLDKIAHPSEFAQAVYNYRLVPLPLLHPFAPRMTEGAPNEMEPSSEPVGL